MFDQNEPGLIHAISSMIFGHYHHLVCLLLVVITVLNAIEWRGSTGVIKVVSSRKGNLFYYFAF
jgi:hypothetical protein